MKFSSRPSPKALPELFRAYGLILSMICAELAISFKINNLGAGPTGPIGRTVKNSGGFDPGSRIRAKKLRHRCQTRTR
jgi:hypothetical protein